jgi:hypothetical protein
MKAPPTWLQTFLDRLAADDLSATTRRGYRYDLLQFIAWYAGGRRSAAPSLTPGEPRGPPNAAAPHCAASRCVLAGLIADGANRASRLTVHL